jgi:hypothetical protein
VKESRLKKMQEAERFEIQIPDFRKRDERPTLFLPLRHSTVPGTCAIGRIVDCRDNRSRSRLTVAARITSPQCQSSAFHGHQALPYWQKWRPVSFPTFIPSNKNFPARSIRFRFLSRPLCHHPPPGLRAK